MYNFLLLKAGFSIAGSRPSFDSDVSAEFDDQCFMNTGSNAAEEQFRIVTQERREMSLLRNEYTKAMSPIWDSFERNFKIRVDYDTDADGNLVLDDEGHPVDLTGNNPFESKSRFLRFPDFCEKFFSLFFRR